MDYELQPGHLVSERAAEVLRDKYGEDVMVTAAVVIFEVMDSDGETSLINVQDDERTIWVHVGMMQCMTKEFLDGFAREE